MRKHIFLFVLFFGSSPVFSQERARALKTWVYDINIIKDQTGKTVKVEKTVFGKGDPGGPVKIRYFETKEKKGPAGNIIYSTTERIGENNVEADILKESETLPITDKNKKGK